MKEKKKHGSLFRLLMMVKPYMTEMIFSAVCLVLVNVADLAKPYILSVIMDDFLVYNKPESGLYSIAAMAVLYLIATAGGSFAMALQTNLMNRAGQGILCTLRRNVFKHIQLMPLKLLDKHSAGRLITRATNDVEAVNEFFTDVLLVAVRDVILLIGIIAIMLSMDAGMALVAFSCVPLIALITILVRRVLRRQFVAMKALIGRINGFFAENISGMRLVQIFTGEKRKLKDFDELNNAYLKTTLKQNRVQSMMRPLLEVINSLAIALVIWYAYGGVEAGLVDLGVLFAFTEYIKKFFNPINELADFYNTVQSAAVSGDRIFELLDEKDQEELLDSGEIATGRLKGKIEFKNVWFSYKENAKGHTVLASDYLEGELSEDEEDDGDEAWVLKDVSFTIEPGQKAAFVGATGSGKTTIISLISRFYDIQKGQILIDGRDINDYTLRNLRSQIAVVLQDVFLFSGTITENIALNDDISAERIQEALRLSCADGFIAELPHGMDEPVTERGSTFSAGQRQLLSFARAIAHDPSIFVLDEATANIDTHTEQLIQRSIENVSAGRTSVFIAHRLSTIQGCDKIIVLSHGEIMEQGTHDELLAMQGYYYNLHNAQYQDADAMLEQPTAEKGAAR